MNKWILGARPRTLPAAIAPVLVAIALVGNDINWLRAVLALKVAVWLQIGVNFARSDEHTSELQSQWIQK